MAIYNIEKEEITSDFYDVPQYLLFNTFYHHTYSPFYILDEVEAALDDTNLRRLVAYLNTLRDSSQFIIITHRRGTMEEADVLYGVTMQEQGVSRMLTINLNDVEKELKLR